MKNILIISMLVLTVARVEAAEVLDKDYKNDLTIGFNAALTDASHCGIPLGEELSLESFLNQHKVCTGVRYAFVVGNVNSSRCYNMVAFDAHNPGSDLRVVACMATLNAMKNKDDNCGSLEGFPVSVPQLIRSYRSICRKARSFKSIIALKTEQTQRCDWTERNSQGLTAFKLCINR